jgi:fused signal recognition particle receptor
VILNRLFKRRVEEQPEIQEGLKKTRRGIFADITALFDRSAIDEELYEDLESLLIQADLGVDTTMELVEALREDVRRERITDPARAREFLRDEMVKLLENATRNRKVKIYQRGVPFVTLVVGVNGTGKTTTIGKLVNFLPGKAMLAAGDTFRAAAIEQLQRWGERTGAPVVARERGADAAAVAHDAVEAAKRDGVDVLLIDTAGRLHTKINLMAELDKVKRVIARRLAGAPHEVLLTIDATTGQNGLRQAKMFDEVAGVTGVILTKLDGTAKGGIALAIANEIGVPIKLVSVGEKAEDLHPFDALEFAEALFGDL